MFNFFEKFKKYRLLKAKDQDEQTLEEEYKNQRRLIARNADGEFIRFLIDYMSARVEINRDKMELLNVSNENHAAAHLKLVAQNDFMREFIADMTSMSDDAIFEAYERDKEHIEKVDEGV